jgi:hypothetical protein
MGASSTGSLSLFNHRVIGIRHRASQTLYVSDIVELPTCWDPAYGKVHVGVYIAVIQDAMDGAKQVVDSSQPWQPSDGEGPSDSHENQDDEAGGMSGGSTVGLAHPDKLGLMHYLAMVYVGLGRYNKAETQ